MNQINVHQGQLMIYGIGLLSLASKLGLSGIRILINNRFVPVRQNSGHVRWLMRSNVPYNLLVHKRPEGKLSITIHRPKRDCTLTFPKLRDLRACFYTLLSIAIVGHWGDRSVLAPDQIRFLMRLSGLKLPNTDQICNSLTGLKTQLLSQTGQRSTDIQRLCHKILPILLKNNPDQKAEIMLGLIKEEGLCNPDHYVPLITTKHDYVGAIFKRLPIKSQRQLQAINGFDKLNQIGDHDYVAVNQNYCWYPLSSQGVINVIDTLIFYLT